MNRLTPAIFCSAALGISLFAGCTRQTSAKPIVEQRPVKAASVPSSAEPDAVGLKILDFAGLERLIAGKRGQVVVVDAWSTACPPCVHDFPQLVSLNRRYAARGLSCISLSFDYEGVGRPEEQKAPVLEFLRHERATFDNVLSSEDPDAMYKKLGVASVPTVLVYDRQGKLRERMQESAEGSGEKPLYDRVEILVKTLLAAPAGG